MAIGSLPGGGAGTDLKFIPGIKKGLQGHARTIIHSSLLVVNDEEVNEGASDDTCGSDTRASTSALLRRK